MMIAVRALGSYPSAQGMAPAISQELVQQFEQANKWLDPFALDGVPQPISIPGL